MEGFTDAAAQTVQTALAHAERRRHPWVGTEHLLLALAEGDDTAARALESRGLTADHVAERLGELVQSEDGETGPPMPFTRTSKRVLELGLRAAIKEGRQEVAREDILVGLLRVGEGGAHELLRETVTPQAPVAAERAAVPATAAGPRPARSRPTERPATPWPPRPGQRIAGWTLGQECLAAPAWAGKPYVWHAADKSGRQLALKLYLLAELGDEQRGRLDVEADMGRRWSRYREVVTTVFAGEVGPYYVIAMPLMGPTLEQHIEERKSDPGQRRPAAEYGEWIRSIANVLQLLHAEDELHRDITARNVMINSDGEGLRLSDFSIAVAKAAERATATGVFVGTHGEVAPEQYRGRASAASDQYQLALVAWRLLTGEHYPADPDGELGRAPRAVLERALSPDPRDRFPNAFMFGNALATALEGHESPLLASFRYPIPTLRRFGGRMGPLLVFAFLIMGWATGAAQHAGDINAATLPTVVGLLLLVGALIGEMAVLTVVRRREGWSSSPPWRAVALDWLPFVVGAAGIAMAEALRPNPAPSDGVLALVPWFLATLVLIVQLLVAAPPHEREGSVALRYGEALLGGRGRRAQAIAIVIGIGGVVLATTVDILYIRARA